MTGKQQETERRLPRGRRGTARRWSAPRAAGVVTGVLLTTTAVAIPQLRQDSGHRSVHVRWQRPVVAAQDLPDRLGVRLEHVALSGDGGLLDLRFQVVDPERATPIHDPKTPPALVDERSGLVVDRLFMGHAHTGAYRQAETYYLIFESTANWVHQGSLVTVLLGDTAIEHVVVV